LGPGAGLEGFGREKKKFVDPSVIRTPDRPAHSSSSYCLQLYIEV
jgi:hypothetical protein